MEAHLSEGRWLTCDASGIIWANKNGNIIRKAFKKRPQFFRYLHFKLKHGYYFLSMHTLSTTPVDIYSDLSPSPFPLSSPPFLPLPFSPSLPPSLCFFTLFLLFISFLKKGFYSVAQADVELPM